MLQIEFTPPALVVSMPTEARRPEHRRSRRVPCAIPLRVGRWSDSPRGEIPFEGTIIDISTGSQQIHAAEGLPPGATLRLAFPFPFAQEQPDVDVTGVVVAAALGGDGRRRIHVQFLEVDGPTTGAHRALRARDERRRTRAHTSMSTTRTGQAGASGNRVTALPFFVARQPIVDHHGRLFAYELLFRGLSDVDHAEFADGSAATAQLLSDGIGVEGLDSLVGDATVFVNFDRNLLTGGAALSLQPAERFVVEVLEDVAPDRDVLSALTELREGGLQVALDDVTSRGRVTAFGPLVDYVKIDVRAVAHAELGAIVTTARNAGAAVLGEKVETAEEFEELRQLGVQYFQGYYLGRPETMRRVSLPSLSGPQARFVAAALRDDIDFDKVASAVSADPGLALRLLTLANAASAMTLVPVRSIRAAGVRAGAQQLRRMAAVLAFVPSPRPVTRASR